jgi:hypothetical protein
MTYFRNFTYKIIIYEYMKETRNFAEFWSSLFAEAQVTYLMFILLTLQTLTKLKTSFGRNLLYWML